MCRNPPCNSDRGRDSNLSDLGWRAPGRQILPRRQRIIPPARPDNSVEITMERRHFMMRSAGMMGSVLVIGSAGLAGCTTTPPSRAEGGPSASRREKVNGEVDGAMSRLYSTVPGSRDLVMRARGVLVFPSVLNAGFVVGGSYGEGALRVGNRTTGYYQIGSISVGWQAGAQSKALILAFMTADALDKFRNSNGWAVGADATVAVAKIGANGVLDTNTAQQPIVGFVVTNAGLMAGLSLEGTKISRLNI
jgi:lipid-binding SYLF domain-containing protein